MMTYEYFDDVGCHQIYFFANHQYRMLYAIEETGHQISPKIFLHMEGTLVASLKNISWSLFVNQVDFFTGHLTGYTYNK